MDGEAPPITRTTAGGHVLSLEPGPRRAREQADRPIRDRLRASVPRLASDRWEAMSKKRVRPLGVFPELIADAPTDALDALEAQAVEGIHALFDRERARRFGPTAA